jgi:predicted  nucleic acid-binding Zn-ribbon protein
MTMELERRVEQLEGNMEAVQQALGQLAQLQVANQQQLNQLSSNRVDQMSQQFDQMSNRVDSFVFEAQRLFTRLGEKSEQSEAAVESISESVGRLTRNAEADRAESRAFRERTDSILQRFDRLIDYLMRDGGDR